MTHRAVEDSDDLCEGGLWKAGWRRGVQAWTPSTPPAEPALGGVQMNGGGHAFNMQHALLDIMGILRKQFSSQAETNGGRGIGLRMAKNDEITQQEDLAFLLFHYADEVGGITKLQKLLFLLQEETSFMGRYEEVSFDFKPYHYGPFSDEVYDAVEFLRYMGAIELLEEEDLDDLRDEEDWGELSGKRFVRTEKGEKMSDGVSDALDEDLDTEFGDVIDEYADMPLEDLLEYVYKQYPEYAVDSEIKDRVLD